MINPTAGARIRRNAGASPWLLLVRTITRAGSRSLASAVTSQQHHLDDVSRAIRFTASLPITDEGSALGEGIKSFGGTWHVVAAS